MLDMAHKQAQGRLALAPQPPRAKEGVEETPGEQQRGEGTGAEAEPPLPPSSTSAPSSSRGAMMMSMMLRSSLSGDASTQQPPQQQPPAAVFTPPKPCQSSNFLRVFRHAPAAVALGLLESKARSFCVYVCVCLCVERQNRRAEQSIWWLQHTGVPSARSFYTPTKKPARPTGAILTLLITKPPSQASPVQIRAEGLHRFLLSQIHAEERRAAGKGRGVCVLCCVCGRERESVCVRERESVCVRRGGGGVPIRRKMEFDR